MKGDGRMNKLEETALVTEWLCDKCGEMIIKPEDGWLEWFRPVDGGLTDEQGYTIRHHDCRQDDNRMFKQGKILSHVHLHHANSNSDLENFLQRLDDGLCKDKSELIEIIKRLHIVGYEAERIKEFKVGY